MKEIELFPKQSELFRSQARFVGGFAGKRGGKTEGGATWSINEQEKSVDYDHDGIDPYLGVIIAPTTDMLQRLSWKKFKAYAKGFYKHSTKNPNTMQWWNHDEERGILSEVYGISGDKPERIEGVKAFWIWIDEVFQVKEQLFLECMARVADMRGRILCTGSLGTNIINPKLHWAYKYFKEQIDADFEVFEWSTSDNPHFPPEEIERLKRTLDEETFRAMFTINWDVTPKSAVYSDLSDANIIKGYQYNPELETYVSVDWGWAHPMCWGVYQYDRKKDIVYKFDEIFGSKITIDKAYEILTQKPYIKTIKKTRKDKAPDGSIQDVEYDFITNITGWCADIAGDQEREQTGKSNIRHLNQRYGINFKRRASKILEGIKLVRSYIKSMTGEIRFFIDAEKCPKTWEGLKRYKFPEKDGVIQNEVPEKKDDDAADETRYFFWNIIAPILDSGPRVLFEGRR